MQHVSQRARTILSLASAALLGVAGVAGAHCDRLDGPVVTAARAALDSNQVERVLVWVPVSEEGSIRKAFQRAQAVRKGGGEAKALADLWFFETLVRIHRASEGAPYTGLQSTDLPIDPAVAAADQALRSGELAPLSRMLETELRKGLDLRFKEARAARSGLTPTDVAKGRAAVASYVGFVHYVEAAAQAAHGAQGHLESAGHAAGSDHPSAGAPAPEAHAPSAGGATSAGHGDGHKAMHPRH